jgi:D-glycero-alpha-D-manno-heptose-7-phosphate kinase
MKALKTVTASAPTRVDLAGGTIDIWPISLLVPGAITVNLSIELRARAVVESRDDDRVTIVSRDRSRRATRRLPIAEDGVSGPLSLLLRLVRAFNPESGIELVTEAAAPAGAGLGGSSTLGIAVGAALNRLTGEGLRRDALLRRVMNLETIELRAPTGNQDYLAALNGGLSAYHHGADGTVRETIPLDRALGKRLVLAYTGQPRRSGFSNWEMFLRFIDGNKTAVRHMEEIGRIAREMRAALRDRRLEDVGTLLGEEGRLRYSLAPSVATPKILAVDAAARRAGALGVKVCGAGGGGCVVAFAGEGRRQAVADAISKAGASILEAPPSRQGLRIEHVDPNGPAPTPSGR